MVVEKVPTWSFTSLVRGLIPLLPSPRVKFPFTSNAPRGPKAISASRVKAAKGTVDWPAMATEKGRVPAAKGEPGTGLKAPVVRSMVYAETLLEPSFATQANLPEGSTATEEEIDPSAKRQPATGLKPPVVRST